MRFLLLNSHSFNHAEDKVNYTIYNLLKQYLCLYTPLRLCKIKRASERFIYNEICLVKKKIMQTLELNLTNGNNTPFPFSPH